MLHGYSDRIHHALAFTAKHHPDRISRYDGHSCLIRASNVAVILARFGADECTIVSSILKQLVEQYPHGRQAVIAAQIAQKFGGMVATTVDAAVEPRYDVLGRERTWKAARLEHLAGLGAAPPRSVDICLADELHLTGSALVDIGRLGVEYVPAHGAPSTDDTRWWHSCLLETATNHPAWNRPGLLLEFRRLTLELSSRLDSRGG